MICMLIICMLAMYLSWSAKIKKRSATKRKKNIISAGTQKNIQIPKMEKKTSVMWRLGRRHAEKKKCLRSNSLFAVSINTDERSFFFHSIPALPSTYLFGMFGGTPLRGVPWGGRRRRRGRTGQDHFFKNRNVLLLWCKKKRFSCWNKQNTHTF